MKKADVDDLVKAVRLQFPSFGGGWVNPDNPISVALMDKPAVFAAGVDVRNVVEFVLKYQAALNRKKAKVKG